MPSAAAKKFAEISHALLSDWDQEEVHPYRARFWKAYLGRAYDLWELFRAHSSERKAWTTPRTYEVDQLASELDIGPDQVLDRLRRLHAEKIMVADIGKQDPARIKSLYLQVFCNLPILTPIQVSRLGADDRAAHDAWLEENLRRLGLGGLN